MSEQSDVEGGAESVTGTSGPVLEILGAATAEQVAALTAVLAAAGGGDDGAPPARRSGWSNRARLVRDPVHPAPGGWRASAFPR